MPPKNRRDQVRDFGDSDTSLVEQFGKGYGVPDSQIEAIIAPRDSILVGAKKINIFKLLPDPTQPRRIMPSAARAYWTGQPDSVKTMLEVWFDLAAGENGGTPVMVDSYLSEAYDPESEVITETDLETKPILSNLIVFLQFARTLMGGLVNPITCTKIPQTDTFRIETGERRWLGFHLLYIVTADEKWLSIPSRDVSTKDVWRQASENNARANLNAVGRAREIALLIMDLYKQQKTKFKEYDEMIKPGECDRAFYAQVADGNEWPIPRGNGGRLLAAVGLSDEAQLRQFRTLLRASDEIWTLADDHNLSERIVRDMMKKESEGKGGVRILTPHGRKPPAPPKILDTLRNAYKDYDETRRQELINQINIWLLELSTGSPDQTDT